MDFGGSTARVASYRCCNLRSCRHESVFQSKAHRTLGIKRPGASNGLNRHEPTTLDRNEDTKYEIPSWYHRFLVWVCSDDVRGVRFNHDSDRLFPCRTDHTTHRHDVRPRIVWQRSSAFDPSLVNERQNIFFLYIEYRVRVPRCNRLCVSQNVPNTVPIVSIRSVNKTRLVPRSCLRCHGQAELDRASLLENRRRDAHGAPVQPLVPRPSEA